MSPLSLGVLASSYVAPAGGLVPTDLTGLFAWFDASDAATITSSGGLVSQLADKSGSARHVTQAIESSKPTTGATAQNGLNVLDFAADALVRHALSIPQPYTVAFVGRVSGTTEWKPTVQVATDPPANSVYKGGGKWLIYNGAALYTSTAPDTDAHQFVSVHNGASSLIRIDGSPVASGNAGTVAGTSIVLGAGAIGFTGWLAEVVIVNGALTGSDLTGLETYLRTKWGTP